MTDDEIRDRIMAALDPVIGEASWRHGAADAVMPVVREAIAAELYGVACMLAALPRVPLDVAEYLRDLAVRWLQT